MSVQNFITNHPIVDDLFKYDRPTLSSIDPFCCMARHFTLYRQFYNILKCHNVTADTDTKRQSTVLELKL